MEFAGKQDWTFHSRTFLAYHMRIETHSRDIALLNGHGRSFLSHSSQFQA